MHHDNHSGYELAQNLSGSVLHSQPWEPGFASRCTLVGVSTSPSSSKQQASLWGEVMILTRTCGSVLSRYRWKTSICRCSFAVTAQWWAHVSSHRSPVHLGPQVKHPNLNKRSSPIEFTFSMGHAGALWETLSQRLSRPISVNIWHLSEYLQSTCKHLALAIA